MIFMMFETVTIIKEACYGHIVTASAPFTKRLWSTDPLHDPNCGVCRLQPVLTYSSSSISVYVSVKDVSVYSTSPEKVILLALPEAPGARIVRISQPPLITRGKYLCQIDGANCWPVAENYVSITITSVSW